MFRALESIDTDERGAAKDDTVGAADSPRGFMQELTDFMLALQPRGILTCLGVRQTSSSVDEELPPEKNQLIL